MIPSWAAVIYLTVLTDSERDVPPPRKDILSCSDSTAAFFKMSPPSFRAWHILDWLFVVTRGEQTLIQIPAAYSISSPE